MLAWNPPRTNSVSYPASWSVLKVAGHGIKAAAQPTRLRAADARPCRHELEVFLPPRSKVLPDNLREGYRNSQMLKYGFLKVGKEVTLLAGAAGGLAFGRCQPCCLAPLKGA